MHDPAPPAGLAPTDRPRFLLAVCAGFRDPYRPVSTHTFAAVAKVPPDVGPGPADLVSRSWLPSTLSVRGAIVRRGQGVNLPLRATLDWAKANRMSVSLWGPYPVRPHLYELFRRRAAALNSAVGYRAMDFFVRRRRVSNCVYGVRGAVADRGRPVSVFGFGERATAETLRLMDPWLLDTRAGGPDLLRLFEVDEAEVIRRPYNYSGPTRWQALRSFLGVCPRPTVGPVSPAPASGAVGLANPANGFHQVTTAARPGRPG